MARGKSERLLAQIPDSYSPRWLENLDKRTRVSQAVMVRIGELEADAGGAENLSFAQRSLIRHAAWMDAVVESHELGLAEGQPLDVGAYTAAMNALLGVYRMVGIERSQRSVKGLREHMNGAPTQVTP